MDKRQIFFRTKLYLFVCRDCIEEPVFPEEILFLLVLHFVRPPAALCVAMRTGKLQKKNFFRKNVQIFIRVEFFLDVLLMKCI